LISPYLKIKNKYFLKLTGELFTRAGLTYLYGLYVDLTDIELGLTPVFLSLIDNKPSVIPTIKLLSPF
jgi:hypothetical protein